jgi:uncharacterized protein (DUF1800 family)
MRLRTVFPALRAATAAVLCSQMVLPIGMQAQAPSGQQATQAATPGASEGDMQLQTREDKPGTPLPEPVNTAAGASSATVTGDTSARLSGDAKILLVLNRFTYGPRPGDLDKVRAEGLTAWFHQQFNPQTIDDSALDARLANYPAMQLPLNRMLYEFPSDQEIRDAAKKGESGGIMIGDASARAVFNDRVEAYRDKKQAQKEGKNGDDDMTGGKAARPEEALPMPTETLLALQPKDRFKELLHFDVRELGEMRKQLSDEQRGKLTQGFTPAQMETLAAFNGPSQVIGSEVVQTKLLRDVYSERQLQEVMVDFWLNHFNVYMRKSQIAPYYIAAYQRDVIRPLAMGRFEDLLLATAQSPAMLDYLDQEESVGPHSEFAKAYSGGKNKGAGLNENYAREVMELHTVGVDGGYTQKDVTELAKVLTGWTVTKGYNKGEPTRAVYDPSKHEPGDKVVLGKTIHDSGFNEGIQVLKMLAESRQCARFISQKLAVRFVSDNPPKGMVERMTGTFLETHGDIRQVLAAMVNSPEFFTVATYRTKVKTPQDFVISAVRATGAQVQNPLALAKAMTDLGMPLYGHQTPDGYSMKSDAWNSTTALVSRMNFSMALASDRVQGVETNLDALLGPNEAVMTVKQKQDDIEARLLHMRVSPRTEALISAETMAPAQQQQAQLEEISAVRGGGERYGKGKETKKMPNSSGGGAMGNLADVDMQAALAAGLVLGSPEFQRR